MSLNARGHYSTSSRGQGALQKASSSTARGCYRSSDKNRRLSAFILGGVTLAVLTLLLVSRRARRKAHVGHAKRLQDRQNLTPLDVDPQLRAVTQMALQPMATELHPRVVLSQNGQVKKEEFEERLQELFGRPITLEEFSYALVPPKGYTGVLNKAVALNGIEPGAIIGMAFKNEKGEIVGSLRHFFYGNGRVVIDLFEVDKDQQGNKFADTINGQSFLRYEKMGARSIGLSADWAGKYLWASLGFSFKDEKQALEDVNKFLVRRFTGDELEQKQAEAQRLVKEPWNLARWDDGRLYDTNFSNRTGFCHAQFPLGKAILLDGGNINIPRDGFRLWKGEMEIDRNNPGYLNALAKLKVEEKLAN